MNNYELTLLLKNKEEMKDLKQFFQENHITINKDEEWGEKTLAYKIKSLTKAFYYLINFECQKNIIPKMRQWLNYRDGVIRYLLLLVE